MQYEVEIGGRRRQVVVNRTGGSFAVAVDGHTHRVEAARIDAHTLSILLGPVRPDGDTGDARPDDPAASREIAVADSGSGELAVWKHRSLRSAPETGT